MDKLIIPLMMYKERGDERKGTKKRMTVVPSWNHLYIIQKNRPILDQWALLHKEKIVFLAKKWTEKHHWSKTYQKKVVVNATVYWNDAREKDCHNVDKLFMDAFNNIIFDDDSNALLRFVDFDIDLENPRIEVSFEVKETFVRKKRREELIKIKTGAKKGKKKGGET